MEDRIRKQADLKEKDIRWSTLMKKAQAGDQIAYRELLEEIHLAIQHFLRRRLTQKSELDDLVQETLLAIHKARHTFDSSQSFSAWMYAISRYKLLDHFRKLGRSKVSLIDPSILSETLFLEKSEDLEMNEQLEIALDRLPQKQREIVQLLKLEGRSVREISESLSMTESAVKVTAHRAYKALRKELVKKSG